MTASYPGALRPYTAKTDLVDHVLASHVNALQEEVAALESTVGLNPQISTSPNSAGTFTAVSTTYATLNARLANIETGVVSDAHSQYVKNTGGSVVTTSSNSLVPLTISAKSGETADIFRVTGVGGTPIYMNVDSTGVLYNNAQAIPLGRVASGKSTANLGPFTGEVQFFALQNVFTAVTGRKYRVTLQTNIQDNSAPANPQGGVLKLHETNNAGATYWTALLPGLNLSVIGTSVQWVWYLDSLSAGSHTLLATFQLSNSGNLTQICSASNPSYMWTEDIGT